MLVLEKGGVSTYVVHGERGEATFGPLAGFMAELIASQAMINEISWTKDLTSRGLAVLDRSWLSLASKLGCCETWTFEGRFAMANSKLEISWAYLAES